MRNPFQRFFRRRKISSIQPHSTSEHKQSFMMGNDLSGGKSKWVVYTVINKEYIEIGDKWQEMATVATDIPILFACADKTSYDFFQRKGIHCVLLSPQQRFYDDRKKKFKRSTFPSDSSAYTVSLKFQVALQLLQEGYNCIFSDADALWISDPIPNIENLDFDIAFQVGSFPKETRHKWGFSACTGFVVFKPSAKTSNLLKNAIERFDGSDQRSLNETLLHDYEIQWEDYPSDWKHCRMEDGWTKTLFGCCARTNLRLAALPHSLYQRHNVTKKDWPHAIVCHPNSPKDQEAKVEVFKSLDLW